MISQAKKSEPPYLKKTKSRYKIQKADNEMFSHNTDVRSFYLLKKKKRIKVV